MEKKIIKEKPVKKAPKESKFMETMGRRKTSAARIRMWTQGTKEFLVNDKPVEQYFKTMDLQKIVDSALAEVGCSDQFKISVKVRGGGFHSQAEAVRHGLAKVLVDFNNTFRKKLKSAGFLTRDSRMRERKKPGLKRARKAPQWSKR